MELRLLDNPLVLHPGGITTVLSRLVALTLDTLGFDAAFSTGVAFCDGTVVFRELLGGSNVAPVVLCVWEFVFDVIWSAEAVSRDDEFSEEEEIRVASFISFTTCSPLLFALFRMMFDEELVPLVALFAGGFGTPEEVFRVPFMLLVVALLPKAPPY